jgi:genome maintenance exonuclease 1
MIDGKRYYATKGGHFPSVTTILGDKKKDSIQAWRNRVGEAEADKIMRQASSRGTGMHTICEDYLNNKDDVYKGHMPPAIALFKQLQPILDERIGRIYGNEIALYSTELKAAGRCDLYAEFDGVPAVVDFKTSTKTKREDWIEDYFLQATCYSMMIEELHGHKIEKIAVLIAVQETGLSQVFVKNPDDYRQMVRERFAEYHDKYPLPTIAQD